MVPSFFWGGRHSNAEFYGRPGPIWVHLSALTLDGGQTQTQR